MFCLLVGCLLMLCYVIGGLFVDVLLLVGCCVIDGWCCCFELSGCMNVASPVGCVFSLLSVYFR